MEEKLFGTMDFYTFSLIIGTNFTNPIWKDGNKRVIVLLTSVNLNGSLPFLAGFQSGFAEFQVNWKQHTVQIVQRKGESGCWSTLLLKSFSIRLEFWPTTSQNYMRVDFAKFQSGWRWRKGCISFCISFLREDCFLFIYVLHCLGIVQAFLASNLLFGGEKEIASAIQLNYPVSIKDDFLQDHMKKLCCLNASVVTLPLFRRSLGVLTFSWPTSHIVRCVKIRRLLNKLVYRLLEGLGCQRCLWLVSLSIGACLLW